MGGEKDYKIVKGYFGIFFEDKESTKSLEIILDIYYDIIYSEVDQESTQEKLFKVLHNLKESNSLNSILKEKDVENLKLLLNDVLKIRYNEKEYYLGNQAFAQLTLDELHRVLLEIKYLKDKQNIKNKELPI